MKNALLILISTLFLLFSFASCDKNESIEPDHTKVDVDDTAHGNTDGDINADIVNDGNNNDGNDDDDDDDDDDHDDDD